MITGQVKWVDVAHMYLNSGIDGMASFHLSKKSPIKVPIGINDVAKHPKRKFVPILRALEDMTEEEARELIQIFLQSDKYDPIEDSELWFEIHRWDNAAMLDGDIAIHFSIVTRCWDGELSICLNGDFQSSDAETGENYRVTNLMEMFHHLICKGFDLFGLIESGQAIRKEVENV